MVLLPVCFVSRAGGGGGALPYLGYTGTCRWIGTIGYGFLASLDNLIQNGGRSKRQKTRRQADSKRNIINLGKREFLPAMLPNDQYVLVRTESDWPYKVENNRIECQVRVLRPSP